MPFVALTKAPVTVPEAVMLVELKRPVDGLNCSLVEDTFSPVIDPVVALVNVK